MISTEPTGASSPPLYHFLAGAWAYVVFGLAATVIGPTLQPIRESFGLGFAQLGLIFPSISGGFIVSSLLGSAASDRYGRLPFIIAGSTLTAAGVGIMSLAPTWPVLLLGGTVAGLGMGLLEGPLNALIVDLTPNGAAKWLNFLHFFFGIGALAGPILTGIALARDVDWRLIYGTVALLGFTTVVPFAFMRTSKPKGGETSSLTAIRKSALQPVTLLIMAVLALYMGVEMTVGGWLPSFLELEHSFSRGLAGVSVSVVWTGTLVGRILTGIVIKWIRPLPLLALSMAIASPLALIASLVENSAMTLTGFGLVGVFIGGTFPTVLAVAVSKQESITGALTGFLMAAAGIGAMVFPPVVGAVAAPMGLRAAMVMIAMLCGITALLVWWAMVHSRRHPGEPRNVVGNVQDPVLAAAAAAVSQTLKRSKK
ncbi:MAG: MFS transporter [Gammaproteobacteria bacterium]|nr:MFS transporter [Gammaproteobacteria bacterium]